MLKFLCTIFGIMSLVHCQERNEGAAKFHGVTLDNSIYYDLKNNLPLKLEIDNSERIPSMNYMSRGLPCSCENLKCGCCAGINIKAFNFERKACSNFTLVPEELALDFKLIIDEREMFNNRLSAKNPAPMCMPLYALPIVNFCVRFFDLGIIDGKINSCVDFETRVATWPIAVLHFDCLRLAMNEGRPQVTWIKPTEAGLQTQKPAIAEADDIFDPVNFEQADLEATNSTVALTPQEQAIGTLKL